MSILKKLFGHKEKEEATAPPPTPKPTPEPIRVTEISAQELQAQLKNGNNVVVVDMRSQWEYQAGHIPGAINMFIQEIPARFTELPKDKPIVFQCWHGNTSLDASGFLIQNGWAASDVASLNGGIAGWVQTHGQDSLVKD
jgi:rhodanese-related sulfurtransferase